KADREHTGVTGTTMKRQLGCFVTLLALGCGQAELVHDLDEAQANRVLVALDESAIRATKSRTDGSEGGWTVTVAAADASAARRALAERELPRERTPGFGEVFGKGSVVPSALEERAL